jgi:hypothetical protein
MEDRYVKIDGDFINWIKQEENNSDFIKKIHKNIVNKRDLKDIKYTLLKQFLLNRNLIEIEKDFGFSKYNDFDGYMSDSSLERFILSMGFKKEDIPIHYIQNIEKDRMFYISIRNRIIDRYKFLTYEKIQFYHVFTRSFKDWKNFKKIIKLSENMSEALRYITTKNTDTFTLLYNNYYINLWFPTKRNLFYTDIIYHYEFIEWLKFVKDLFILFDYNISYNSFKIICEFCAMLYKDMVCYELLLKEVEEKKIEEKIPLEIRKKYIKFLRKKDFSDCLDKKSISFNEIPCYQTYHLNVSCLFNKNSKNIRLIDKYSEISIFRIDSKFKFFEKTKKFTYYNMFKNSSLDDKILVVPGNIFYFVALNYMEQLGDDFSPYWPFKEPNNITKIMLRGENDEWKKDKNCPLLKIEDIFRLNIILSTFKFTKERIDFLEKFVKKNFSGLNRYFLDEWLFKNGYCKRKWSKYKTYVEVYNFLKKKK